MKRLLLSLTLLLTFALPGAGQEQTCTVFVLNLSDYQTVAWFSIPTVGASGFFGNVQPGSHAEVSGTCLDDLIQVHVVSMDPHGPEQTYDMVFRKNEEGVYHPHVFALIVNREAENNRPSFKT